MRVLSCCILRSAGHHQRAIRSVAGLILSAAFGIYSSAQTTTSPQRDPSALAFLAQVVSVSGGEANLTAIADYRAVGTITHAWNNKTKQGQLTVKSRGFGQFRIDSVLSQGTWSLIVNNGAAEIAFPDGTTAPIAGQNQMNFGWLTWPILNANAAMQDQTTVVIDEGLVPFGSGQARQIRIQQTLAADPTGALSKLTQRDYFFDPATFLLLRVQDSLYPDNAIASGALTHEIDFGNYQTVNGLTIPFLVTETVSGNQTWQLQLSSIGFNTGLTDSDFVF